MNKLDAMTDHDLAELYEQGNDKAFDELLRRHQDYVYSYILFICKNEDTAQDVFQDTFARAIVAIRNHKYQKTGKFSAWLVRIAHNLAIDRTRNAEPGLTLTHDDLPLGVTNSLRLLNLPENVLELLKSGFLNTGHAKVILGLPTPELQEQAAQMIADHELNVRQAEVLCKKLARPAKGPAEPAPIDTLPVEVEESLKEVLGSEVNVAYHGGKGRLTVHFYSDEQLRAFANLLGQYQQSCD